MAAYARRHIDAPVGRIEAASPRSGTWDGTSDSNLRAADLRKRNLSDSGFANLRSFTMALSCDVT